MAYQLVTTPHLGVNLTFTSVRSAVVAKWAEMATTLTAGPPEPFVRYIFHIPVERPSPRFGRVPETICRVVCRNAHFEMVAVHSTGRVHSLSTPIPNLAIDWLTHVRNPVSPQYGDAQVQVFPTRCLVM